jgi:hypothetical protein
MVICSFHHEILATISLDLMLSHVKGIDLSAAPIRAIRGVGAWGVGRCSITSTMTAYWGVGGGATGGVLTNQRVEDELVVLAPHHTGIRTGTIMEIMYKDNTVDEA